MINIAEIMPIILFFITILGMAVKYGMDMQRLASTNDLQNMRLTNIENDVKAEKAHNASQHIEFYENRNWTIELKTDMKHIMDSLIDIKEILSSRRA